MRSPDSPPRKRRLQFSLKTALIGLTATCAFCAVYRDEIKEAYETVRQKVMEVMTGKDFVPVPAQVPAQPSSGLQFMESPLETITHLRLSHTPEGIRTSSMQGPPLFAETPRPPSELPFLPPGACIDIHMGDGEISIDVPPGIALSSEDIAKIIAVSGWTADGLEDVTPMIIRRGANGIAYLIRPRKQRRQFPDGMYDDGR